MNIIRYTLALEKFINSITASENSLYENSGAVHELCEVLEIGRIEICSFDNPAVEHINSGQTKVYCELGTYCKDISVSERNVTSNMNVVTYTAYALSESTQWSDEIKDKVRIVLQILFAFHSRDNLMQVVDKLTFFDQETGINNVRYYFKHLVKLNEQKMLSGKYAIRFNLKRFSSVNERIGRSKATMVMRSFLCELSAVIGKDETLCRLGGDNFLMLVNSEHIEKVIDMLRGIDIVFNLSTEETINISACAGVLLITENPNIQTASDIIDRITIAINIAKKSGEQDIVFFDESMITTKSRNMKIVNTFPQALQEESLKVYYQPKISLDGYTIAGAEALCRWIKDGKTVLPDEFIPVLEQGLEICSLDFYILEHVCRDIRRWLDNGKNVVKISVNLSRRHMSDMDLLKHVIEIVDRYSIPHKYIEIELTETTTDVEFKDLKRIVSGLQAEGFSTSVDDFGIGYSSLTLIKDIPWDVLKVDKSFLPNDGEHDEKQKKIMFKYVLAMAQEMGIECIAEGVETISQLQLLKENCCNLAQGFFFDRPLAVDDFEKRLDDRSYSVSGQNL